MSVNPLTTSPLLDKYVIEEKLRNLKEENDLLKQQVSDLNDKLSKKSKTSKTVVDTANT